jgi:hypothetical protein
MSATAITIAPVSVAGLHAGIGAANRASVEAPEHWQARAAELLSEKHSADVAEAIVARIEALQAFLNEGPNPWAYEGHGGAMNVLPVLFDAAASCELDSESGRFDRTEIERLCTKATEAAA